MEDLEKKRRPGGATDEEIADRLLRAAKPVRDAAREAVLLDRIAAAAERTPHLVSTGGAPRPSIRIAAAAASAPTSRRSAARFATGREMWGAGALLAASLLLGVALGHTSLPHAAAAHVVDATGVALSSTQDIALALASTEDDDL